MENLLETYLRQQIAAKGSISVAEYMQACLAHPLYGYYIKGNPIGTKGDFVTAPEISQVFGELIGVWCHDLWQQMSQPANPHLIELGPGRGTLMQDLLRSFPGIYDVHMVEISPALQFEQRQQLRGHPIKWHTSIAEALNACNKGPVFIIANEFFDALPIRQFQHLNHQWHERMVSLDPVTGNFCFSLKREENQYSFPKANDGNIIEISPLGHEIIHKITHKVCSSNGAALIIDYGYQEQVLSGTFQAVREHTYYNVLKDPGEADLTAHVNFAALTKEAKQIGAKVYGPVFQSDFLKELGIEIRAKMLQSKVVNTQASEIAIAVNRLIDPAEMGTLFKAMAIVAPLLPEPCGFATTGFSLCSSPLN